MNQFPQFLQRWWQTPSDPADLASFPSPCLAGAPGTWGSRWPLGCWSRWGGHSSGLSQGTPWSLELGEPCFTFPGDISCIQAVTISTAILSLSLKLFPSHYWGVTHTRIRICRWSYRRIRLWFLLWGLFQNTIMLSPLNTKKQYLSKDKTLVVPSWRSSHSMRRYILEILRYCTLQCYDVGELLHI